MFRVLAFLLCLLASQPCLGALATTDLNSQSPATMVASFLGPGITPSNITYSGHPSAAGTFSGGAGIVGFPSGIVLSSGNIAGIIGPNNSSGMSTAFGGPGDMDLNFLTGVGTNDAAVLEFDFVPGSSVLLFSYVFASEEYPEYVGQYNDGFALFVNGVNVALVPGTGIPVTINNVNFLNNSAYYIDNAAQPGPLNTQMDGLTTVLGVTVTVNAGMVNHIKIAVADAQDASLDTVVMLRANSFTAPSATPTRTPTRTVSPTFTASPTRTASPTVSPSFTITPSFTETPTFSFSPTETPSFTITQSHTDTPTPTPTPTWSATPSVTPTSTPTPTLTASPTVTNSFTMTPTATQSSTRTISPTFSASPSVTPTFTTTPLPLILHLLLPNPNPAGGDLVWLPWFISVDSDVGIDVFSVAGERVRSLEARRYRAGSSERDWDLRNDSGQKVASGTFIYRVTAVSDRNEKISDFSKCAVVR